MIRSCMSVHQAEPADIPTGAAHPEAIREAIPTAADPMEGGSYQNAQQDPRLQAAVNYINSRRFREALNTLDQISERSALWYYLSGCANAGLGNNVLARDHAAQAVNMEPNNLQYRQLLNQLEFSSRRYQNSPYGTGYGMGGSSCGTGNFCCGPVAGGYVLRMYGRRSLFMHVKAKTVALGGLLLALTIVFMALGSVIETSTLFLLAAASFFVGIVIREFGLAAGGAFYLAAVLLGVLRGAE